MSLSNHLYDLPYPKTIMGEQMFKEIVENFNQVNKKGELLEKIFELAKHDSRYL